MNAYYNEIDTYCSKWLERLISSNVLPQGIVDNRSIIMANYVNLGLFNQCHFFAGIGGWPLALRMSNWPKDEPIWTGSCPCQPFSIASPNRSRTADDRHQWPNFFQLIEKHRPSTVFGEQVAGMMACHGSPISGMTLKELTMLLGPRICQLSGHPTGEAESSGWPTPAARDWKDLSLREKGYSLLRRRHQPSTVTTAYERGLTTAQIPHLLCHIMGFPDLWILCAPLETR